MAGRGLSDTDAHQRPDHIIADQLGVHRLLRLRLAVDCQQNVTFLDADAIEVLVHWAARDDPFHLQCALKHQSDRALLLAATVQRFERWRMLVPERSDLVRNGTRANTRPVKVRSHSWRSNQLFWLGRRRGEIGREARSTRHLRLLQKCRGSGRGRPALKLTIASS